MCGIVGYIGNKTAQEVLLSGLKQMEYRGYDSAGIITADETKATLLRAPGKVSGLASKIVHNKRKDTVGIGHTRWATHGEPSERNAHPHVAGSIYLVHNGIIENFRDLKKVLEQRGYAFASDTDTEVLAALVDSTYKAQKDHDLHQAVIDALQMVIGAYGIAVMAEGNLDEIVVARKGSPLVIGIGQNETYIASDPSALVGYTNKVIYLNDNEVARCTQDGVYLTDTGATVVTPTVEELEMDIQAIQKHGFDHFLLKEIFDQPESVRATLSGRIAKETDLLRLGGINMTNDELREIKHIYVLACGTASYAGLLASYYIEQLTDDVMVHPVTASEFRYRASNIPPHSVALFVSQSGETADTIACLQDMKRKGVRCLGIINAVGSTIAREVDGGVYLHAGTEISVASTKAFTSQVVALLLFGLVVAQAKGLDLQILREYIADLDALPAEIQKILDTKPPEIKKLAKQYTKYDHAFYLGRDTLFPIAMEGALKLKETSYIHAEGQAAGELKHGSISLVDDRFFEVAFMDDNWLYEKSMSNVIEVQTRGGHVIVITNSSKEIDAETVIRVKTKLKHLTPLVYNVVSQLLAYYIAIGRVEDVDRPRNLAKSVTVE